MAAEETILNGRYQLVAQQGSGGMAVVYKATDLALSRSVAIKILRPSLTSDPQFLVRFRQEARNVANLAHPNIVTLHDVGQDGNTYYMVMEFIDGQDLKKIVRSAAPLSVERVMNLTVQICAGLGYAHRSELVHADVKPQNILMTSGDMVKITDFGIAQAISQTQAGERQRTNVVWGSPHYFAPEQARGEPPTPASDVYAIGVVMFEMLTGKLPYSGNSGEELALAHVKEQIPHVRDVNPSIPQRLDWLVHKVMSKEPEQRYRNADQLGRILAQIVTEGMGSSATPPKPPTQAAPKPVGTRAAPNVIMPDKSSPQPPPDPSSGAAKPVFLPPVAPIQSTPQPYAQPYQPGGAPGTPQAPTISQGGSYTPPDPSRPVSGGFGSLGNQTFQPPPAYTPPPQGVMPIPTYTPNPGQNQPVSGTSGTRSDLLQSYSQSYSYQYIPPPARLEMATLLLAGLAAIAVIGLIVLWLFVWSAWSS